MAAAVIKTRRSLWFSSAVIGRRKARAGNVAKKASVHSCCPCRATLQSSRSRSMLWLTARSANDCAGFVVGYLVGLYGQVRRAVVITIGIRLVEKVVCRLRVVS